MKFLENTGSILTDSAQAVMVDPFIETASMTRQMVCGKRRRKFRALHALGAAMWGIFTFPFRFAWKVIALPMHVYKKRQARKAVRFDLFEEMQWMPPNSTKLNCSKEPEDLLDFSSARPRDFVMFGYQQCGQPLEEVMDALKREEIRAELINEGYRKIGKVEDCGCFECGSLEGEATQVGIYCPERDGIEDCGCERYPEGEENFTPENTMFCDPVEASHELTGRMGDEDVYVPADDLTSLSEAFFDEDECSES